MADTKYPNAPAEPPGGGAQDHDTMRRAAMRTVTGPASTNTLAASGGLDVPGRESHPELAGRAPGPDHGGDAPGPKPAVERIPGERDPSTSMHRQPGAVSGQFAGADIPPQQGPSSLDDRTTSERRREGGGDPSPRDSHSSSK